MKRIFLIYILASSQFLLAQPQINVQQQFAFAAQQYECLKWVHAIAQLEVNYQDVCR